MRGGVVLQTLWEHLQEPLVWIYESILNNSSSNSNNRKINFLHLRLHGWRHPACATALHISTDRLARQIMAKNMNLIATTEVLQPVKRDRWNSHKLLLVDQLPVDQLRVQLPPTGVHHCEIADKLTIWSLLV